MVLALVACGNAATTEEGGQASGGALNNATAAQSGTTADSDVAEFAIENLPTENADFDTKGMTFYWVAKVLGGTYWTGVETGLTAAKDEMGLADIVYAGVEKETDVDVWLNNLQNAVTANPDAILAAPVDSYACDQPLKDCGYEGPIVLIDTVIATSGGYDVGILTDNGNAGRAVARLLMTGLQEKGYTEGCVGFDCVNNGSQTVIDRIDGFKAFWEENAAEYGVENVECLWEELKVDEGDSNMAMTYGQDLQTAHADLVGLAGFNGSSVYFISSLKEAQNDKVIGVGMDFNVDSYDLMQTGFEYASVAQSTYNMGYYGCWLAVSILNGAEYDSTRIDSGLLEVTQENMEGKEVQDYIAILRSAS